MASKMTLKQIQCKRATLKDKSNILRLAAYYEYDMSLYCGDLPGWEFPEEGYYCSDCLVSKLHAYFTEPHHYPFLIRVENELAGFAMVYQPMDLPVTDWRMGEFFILNKFKGKGVGQTVAYQLFNQFKGKWSVPVIPQNQGALAFWQHIISKYSANAFTENTFTLHDPNPINMIVFQFNTNR